MIVVTDDDIDLPVERPDAPGGNQDESKIMKFREMPVLERKSGMMLWPPQWSTAYRAKKDWPQGEIGTLENVWMHELLDRCIFLYVSDDGFQYTGSMYFDDHTSCLIVFDFLQSVVGRSIADIGELDVSHLL